MNEFHELEPQLLQAAVEAVKSCWDEGSPVAGDNSESWEQIARIGLRRIRSFERRQVSLIDRTAQIKDIAEGFVQAFESNSKLVGPLIQDYKHVASVLLDAVENFESFRHGTLGEP
jgi:hypothetical protein